MDSKCNDFPHWPLQTSSFIAPSEADHARQPGWLVRVGCQHARHAVDRPARHQRAKGLAELHERVGRLDAGGAERGVRRLRAPERRAAARDAVGRRHKLRERVPVGFFLFFLCVYVEGVFV